MVITDHEADSGEPSRFQTAEQVLISRRALGIGHRNTEGLPMCVVPTQPTDQQHSLARDRSIDAHMLVARIDPDVRVTRRGECSLTSCSQVRVQPPCQDRDLTLRETRPTQRLSDRRYRAGQDPLDVHLHQTGDQRLLAAIGNARTPRSKRSRLDPAERLAPALPTRVISIRGFVPL